jgi:hypothetical protein
MNRFYKSNTQTKKGIYMKKSLITCTAFFITLTGSAMAANGASDTFVRINAECSSVKECTCQEVCYDTCRIVNGENVCDESCKTICEYATSKAEQ